MHLQVLKGNKRIVANPGIADEIIQAIGDDTGSLLRGSSNAVGFGHIQVHEEEAAVVVLCLQLLQTLGAGSVSGRGNDNVVLVLEL